MNGVARLAKYCSVLFFTVALVLSFTASADVDVSNARIDKIGLFDPNATKGAMVQLTDLASVPAWTGSRQFFLSQAELGDQGLAMVLTAYALEQNLWVRIAGTAEALSLITVIYVNKP